MSGETQEKSGNFEVDDKWQPCFGCQGKQSGNYKVVFLCKND